MKPPIIYFKTKLKDHYADQFDDYFSYSVAATRKYNPDSPIIIIGDENPKYPATQFVHIVDLANPAEALLDDNYLHLSPNKEDFERNAIKRWATIGEYLFQTNTEKAVLVDLDVWVIRDVEELFKLACPNNKIALHLHPQWETFDNQYKNGACAHFMLMNNLKAYLQSIEHWIELMADMKENYKNSQIGKWHKQRLHGETSLTDMILWAMATWKNPEPFVSTRGFQKDGSLFDTAINQSDGLAVESGTKSLKLIAKLIDKEGARYFGFPQNGAELVRLNTLHIHGGCKKYAKELFEKYEP